MSFYRDIKKYDNSQWLKVFFHSNKGGSTVSGFTDEDEAKYCVNNQYKFSILSKINKNYKTNNAYEFILEYPELGTYNRWRQDENPLNIEEDDTSGTSPIKGFVPIETKADSSCWSGLAKTKYPYSTGKIPTLLDGCPTSDAWNFAIGMYKGEYWTPSGTISYSIPANSVPTNTVALWIKIPHNMLCSVNKCNHKISQILIFLTGFIK